MLSNERLQILKMVKEERISAEEGVKLLEALETGHEQIAYKKEEGKFLRIKVFDPKDETKVNISLPISLLRIGLKLASKVAPELKNSGISEEDLEEILREVDKGKIGNIIEVDSGDGTKVEIVVE